MWFVVPLSPKSCLYGFTRADIVLLFVDDLKAFSPQCRDCVFLADPIGHESVLVACFLSILRGLSELYELYQWLWALHALQLSELIR